jgi:hypothetical protein
MMCGESATAAEPNPAAMRSSSNRDSADAERERPTSTPYNLSTEDSSPAATRCSPASSAIFVSKSCRPCCVFDATCAISSTHAAS